MLIIILRWVVKLVETDREHCLESVVGELSALLQDSLKESPVVLCDVPGAFIPWAVHQDNLEWVPTSGPFH